MGRESLVPGMRELVVTQTELIVLYVVENEAVVVLGVVSGRQDR
jgi:plasmid stabilization system protein ParE